MAVLFILVRYIKVMTILVSQATLITFRFNCFDAIYRKNITQIKNSGGFILPKYKN